MKSNLSRHQRYKRFCAITLLTVTAASASTFAAGTIYYRWIDEQGNTIHSDRPPPTGTEYEEVNAGEGFSYTIPHEEGAQAKPAAKPITVKSRKDPTACQQARDNMSALQGKDKIAVRDENGEVKILDAEEIKMQLETTRGHIEIFCE